MGLEQIRDDLTSPVKSDKAFFLPFLLYMHLCHSSFTHQ